MVLLLLLPNSPLNLLSFCAKRTHLFLSLPYDLKNKGMVIFPFITLSLAYASQANRSQSKQASNSTTTVLVDQN